MKNNNSIWKPLTWSFLLLAAFFSYMYYHDHIHKNEIEDAKSVLTKTQAEAGNEKKMYGKVTDSTQHKLDSLEKNMPVVEHAK